MSYYLLAQIPVTTIKPTLENIVFASVLQDSQRNRTVFVICSSRRVKFYQYRSSNQIIYQTVLTYKGKLVEYVVKVEEFNRFFVMITRNKVYLLKKEHAIQAKKEKKESIQVDLLEIVGKKTGKAIDYSHLMNKDIKILEDKGNISVKLSGRTKTQIHYFYGPLNPTTLQAQVQFQQQQNPLLTCSLESPTPSLLLYQTYTNKSKPIKILHTQFLIHPQQQTTQLRTEYSINHFNKHMTVVALYQLNSELFCLLGNESIEGKDESVMIVYNFREKFTRNYISFKDTLIQKCFCTVQGNYEWFEKKGTISIDAFASDNNQTKCFQLTPESYHCSHDSTIKGNFLSSSASHITTTHNKTLLLHQKHTKPLIYRSFLQRLLPTQPALHFLIQSLLK